MLNKIAKNKYHNAIVKSFKGSQSLRNADRGNKDRKWDLIASGDEIIENTGAWNAVKEYSQSPTWPRWWQYESVCKIPGTSFGEDAGWDEF